jgi:hypothetical protein
MPPRTARCCQAVKNIRPSTDSIWISDALLAIAFERYYKVSISARQFSSFFPPGPLESRRRLGKRTLAAIHSEQAQATLPPWALGRLPDLTRWSWEPPTELAVREKRKSLPKRWTVGDALDKLIVALEHGSAVEPEAPLNQQMENTQADTFIQEMDDITQSMRLLSQEDLERKIESVATSLRTWLLLGTISADQLNLALRDLSSAFQQRPSDHSLIDGLLLKIYASVVDGITASRVQGVADFCADFWNGLLIRLSQLSPTHGTIGLFRRIMNALPAHYISDTEEGVQLNLETIFDSSNFEAIWRSASDDSKEEEALSHLSRGILDTSKQVSDHLMKVDRHNAAATAPNAILSSRHLENTGNILTQVNEATRNQVQAVASLQKPSFSVVDTNALASCLHRLSSENQHNLLHCITVLVSERHNLSFDSSKALRLYWLEVLAKMPLVKQDALFGAMAETFAGLPEVATNHEFCQLLIYQWTSRGYSANPGKLQLEFDQLCDSQSDAASIASLIAAICTGERVSQKKTAMLVSFLEALRRHGRYDRIFMSFAALCERGTIPIQAARFTATLSNDVVLALELYSLCKKHTERLGRLHVLKQWGWSFWAQYMKRMIVDENIPPRRVWEVLGVPLYQDKRSHEEALCQRDVVTPDKAKLIENMALWFTQRKNISNRMALRYATQCILYLQHHGVRPTDKILLVLAKVITRDLANGDAGRTSRLVWIRDLIAKHQGLDQAVAIEAVMSEWRRANRRLHGCRSRDTE